MPSIIPCILIILSLFFATVVAAPTVTYPHMRLLAAHNDVRATYGAPALNWSQSLATAAETWANQCVFENTGGSLMDTPYGEISAAGTGAFTAEAAVNLFIQDGSEYDPVEPTYNHFTQVVWKGTTSIGCAVAHCNNIFPSSDSQATYYVCLYDPPGNVVGLAPQNV
jgi:pathogenesis-related protein 1